jgi:hypothetical protein
MSCTVEGSWSAGIGYSFICEDGYDYDYFKPFMYKKPYELQADVGALEVSKDIKGFKEKYHILEIKELFFGPCGHNVFTIINDKFVMDHGEFV